MVVVGGRRCEHESGEVVACERNHSGVHLVYEVEIVECIVDAFVLMSSGVGFGACDDVEPDGHVSHADVVSELPHVVLFKLNKDGGNRPRRRIFYFGEVLIPEVDKLNARHLLFNALRNGVK